MTADVFVQRIFVVDGREIVCRFFKPEAEGQDCRCRYDLEWTEGLRSRWIYGVDEVQALLLAMQIAHTDLLAARENDGRQVSWLDQRSLGLPIASSIRDWDPDGDL
jgi:hypothetical protein